MRLRNGWLVLGLACVAAHAGEPVRNIEVHDPRAFGHFIGDTLLREVTFEVVKPWQLSPADGAQKLGRTNSWVELIASRTQITELADGRRYHIVQTYQIVNSPEQPSLITIPGVDTHLLDGGNSANVRLPDWRVSLAPLTGPDVRQGLDAVLPSRTPQAIKTRQILWRVAAAGSSSVILTAWLAWNRWGFLLFRSLAGPFGNARRSLKSLARQPDNRERVRAALRIVHRAFDETAGQRVFGERLDEFFAQHAEFADSTVEVRRFYEMSRREFFGAGADVSFQSLTELVETLRVRERSTGREHAAAA